MLLNSYLKASLATDAALSKEQSCPPNPLLQEHDAEHVTVGIVQLYRLFPEGSEYLQAPCPEHTMPEREETRMCKDKCDQRCTGNFNTFMMSQRLSFRKRWAPSVLVGQRRGTAEHTLC